MPDTCQRSGEAGRTAEEQDGTCDWILAREPVMFDSTRATTVIWRRSVILDPLNILSRRMSEFLFTKRDAR